MFYHVDESIDVGRSTEKETLVNRPFCPDWVKPFGHKKRLCILQFAYSLGQAADVTLRHAKGKIAENRVYTCALPSAHGYARYEGEKGDDFPDVRPSEYLVIV